MPTSDFYILRVSFQRVMIGFIYETHIQQPNISLTFAFIALHVFASFGKQHNGWSWLWALIELKGKVDCYSFYTVFSGLTIYKL